MRHTLPQVGGHFWKLLDLRPSRTRQQLDSKRLGRWVGAVLGVKLQLALPAEQVQVRVAPRVQIARSPQRLTGLPSTRLPHVVHDRNGHSVGTLKCPHEPQQLVFGRGRKNRLFAGSDAGGNWLAILHTVVRTCQRLSITPFEYLAWALPRLSDLLVNPGRRTLASLTPMACAAAH